MKQMNKEMSHTYVQGLDGSYRKNEKESLMVNDLGFRHLIFKTKHYV